MASQVPEAKLDVEKKPDFAARDREVSAPCNYRKGNQKDEVDGEDAKGAPTVEATQRNLAIRLALDHQKIRNQEAADDEENADADGAVKPS
jgi:hypothetical protein